MASKVTSKTTLNDAAWKELQRRFAGIERASVRVGLVGPAASAEQDGVSLLDIGIFHELGTRFIPARSWLRRTFEVRYDELRAMQLKIAKALVLGKVQTIAQAMGLLGAWGAGAIRAFVTQGNVTPPLAAETIRRKGSSKPLVDTGAMINAVTWQVDEGNGG